LAEIEEQAPLNVPSPDEKQQDELEVFLDAMKDVTKIDREETRTREPTRKDDVLPSRRIDDCSMDEVLKDSYTFNVVNLPEYMEGYVDDLNPLVMEKLRGGEFSVQKVLDLHGLSAGEAYDVFHLFIKEAVRSQVCCVRIVHGRGLKSRNGPVLKEKLKEWILRAMHRKWVVAFSSSRMSDGGPGATTVLLRTKARKKKLHIIG
jgi:DNA-nicking Smr family endonuclease